MNPKQFLAIAGAVLIIMAVLGFVGVIGPTEEKSIFGPAWWFDTAENRTHLVIGIASLASAFVLPPPTKKGLTVIVGMLALMAGIYSLLYTTLLGANLENPADTVLHIALALWALSASRKH